jgi:hypothetical protein
VVLRTQFDVEVRILTIMRCIQQRIRDKSTTNNRTALTNVRRMLLGASSTFANFASRKTRASKTYRKAVVSIIHFCDDELFSSITI